MSRQAYVNGRFVPHGKASVHIEDRGYQFADGIYEVWAIFNGQLSDAEGHFRRMARSLDELRIPHPMERRALEVVLKETLRRNRVREGLLYLQVTRGVARRDHPFPTAPTPPSLVITAKSLNRTATNAKAEQGIGVITLPENRWGRCDIKTVGLLPNVLAKQAAREQGCGEAWFVDSAGLVTEGASSNAWILTKDGVLKTRDTQANILRGVTRSTLLEVIAGAGIPVEEVAFTPQEAHDAQEVFITGAGALVTPVVSIDGHPVGNGQAGETALRLRSLYIARAQKSGI
jgi:D-alanine transaminase